MRTKHREGGYYYVMPSPSGWRGCSVAWVAKQSAFPTRRGIGLPPRLGFYIFKTSRNTHLLSWLHSVDVCRTVASNTILNCKVPLLSKVNCHCVKRFGDRVSPTPRTPAGLQKMGHRLLRFSVSPLPGAAPAGHEPESGCAVTGTPCYVRQSSSSLPLPASSCRSHPPVVPSGPAFRGPSPSLFSLSHTHCFLHA